MAWSSILHAICVLVLADTRYLVHASSSSATVRVVTWNVNDNAAMNKGFTDEAIKKVLGLDKRPASLPTVYAIGLEENCWMCNEGNLPKLADRFLTMVNKAAGGKKYEVVGAVGTRMNKICESMCKFHGTTALVVVAKQGAVKSHDAFNFNGGCSDTTIPNHEKGVAAMKVQLITGKSLCFGAAHLASGKPSYRRGCFQGFFASKKTKTSWASCSAEFLFGDFNTRTGDKTAGPSTGKYVPMGTNVDQLKLTDELTGKKPYGTDSHWKSSLLAYINSVSPRKYSEGKVGFMPTYSIKFAKKECGGKFPCYRANRPMSWTDRIIYTAGKLTKYDAVYDEYGDHFPVYAEFAV